jgi:hypothetical protein
MGLEIATEHFAQITVITEINRATKSTASGSK